MQVDRDGSGTISLSEYFGIFEEHGVKISKAECERLISYSHYLTMNIYLLFFSRVHKVVGPDGLLKKDDFIRILQSSNFFMKTFDKNQDGIVTEVGYYGNLLLTLCKEQFLRVI